MSRQRPAREQGLDSLDQPQQPDGHQDSQQPALASEDVTSRTYPDSAAPTAPNDGSSGSSKRDAKGKQKVEDHQDGWLTRSLARFGSLSLENKGSVARDHLALERTFLAWLRTSLSFASIGIAVTQLFRLNASIGTDPASEKGIMTLRRMGKPLGATFLGIAILVLLIGLNRYYESQNWLLKGKFPASRGSILFLAVIAAALIICSLTIIIAVNPSVTKG
ncbi:hypothetical protein DRE_04087 [Drechslerella stenobrocha 248]|uniref:DUF202 domain-containing protein n=1 Tax=Drechslerella stenobrocha 248 TaxID=1043628 RepID=W7IC00_9PEZI|nr:hypothetical protein DRE_04087 [Drechslerella stenobrocha 248]